MLTVNNLTKIYKTKGGVEVKALDNVTVNFPETGMIFLLGKSGSGKSTLLNVSGGLDKPTDGEIIVKGKSSKEFTLSDWDGYRNTYVGFVFQEYNILDEFTIEENIAIALRLQNKESDDAKVNDILTEVDLNGYGQRKPNTLSGGQKQRVAIARALIKDPKIIMADEPTGALDSETGKQVFETLKKLSKKRLVIVVSHDREFAEQYGDRIIELEDGKVISDSTKEILESNQLEENLIVVDQDTVTVKDWKKLSKDDIEKIISIMSQNGEQTVITKDAKHVSEISKVVSDKKIKSFKPTEKREYRYHGEPASFIESKLPFVHALKMAWSAIKSKPIRLIFTIFLSVLAFTFFGISSTLMLYDPSYSISKALEKTDYSAYVLEKNFEAERYVKYATIDGEKLDKMGISLLRGAYSNEDLELLNKNDLGLDFAGIVDLGAYRNSLENVDGYSSGELILQGVTLSHYNSQYYYKEMINGFYDGGEEWLISKGFSPVGESKYPEKANEIAIPEYFFEMIKNSTENRCSSVEELLGKEIDLSIGTFTVTGVYNVGKIPERFEKLKYTNNNLSPIERDNLKAELRDYISCSFHSIFFASPEFYETYKYEYVKVGERTGHGMELAIAPSGLSGVILSSDSITVYTPRSVWQNKEAIPLYDLNGNKVSHAQIQENEAYINVKAVISQIQSFYNEVKNNPEYSEFNAVFEKYYSRRLTYNDYSIIIKTVCENYEKEMGEKLRYNKHVYTNNVRNEKATLDVVGFFYINKENYGNYFISDLVLDKYETHDDTNYGFSSYVYETKYEANVEDEKYGKIISLTNGKFDQTKYTLRNFNGWKNAVKCSVFESSRNTSQVISTLKIVFCVLAGVVGIFASLMLLNFISLSITNKTKEIGILRAIGATGKDVFRIFITEAFIITGVCFILSIILSILGCYLMNVMLSSTAFGVSILNFSVLNVLIILVICVLVSIIGTASPVKKASKRSPVESIRTV